MTHNTLILLKDEILETTCNAITIELAINDIVTNASITVYRDNLARHRKSEDIETIKDTLSQYLKIKFQVFYQIQNANASFIFDFHCQTYIIGIINSDLQKLSNYHKKTSQNSNTKKPGKNAT